MRTPNTMMCRSFGSLFALPPAILALIAHVGLVCAQSPPPPVYQNVLQSPVDSSVTVSYKQPTLGTCTTLFTTQQQYTGYIRLPPFALAPIQQNYSINTFFWFIEARSSPETAPLTIWLSGGPGTSSMFGLFNEAGPCEVVQMADGSYGTTIRPFGWDRASNLLFIDQPNQVGFSYDTARNASFDLYANEIFEPPTRPNPGLPNFMYLNGTFGSANANSRNSSAATANTTEIAAAATWHFLQTWLSTFPQYNPASRPNATNTSATPPTGINLFTESYGGRYGPIFASYFNEKNSEIENGTLARDTTLFIKLESLGIINGLVDPLIQNQFYPSFAYNNSYGVQAISVTDQLNAIDISTNQCTPAIQACRSAGADIYGDNSTVNDLCKVAATQCNSVMGPYVANGYDVYDIRQKIPSPDPPAAYQEYLNNGSVLQSIGAQINFTESNQYVYEAFWETGDFARGGTIKDIAQLLSQGVRVALIYGDADYICNWQGGQAVSHAIAAALPTLPSAAPGWRGGPNNALPLAKAFETAGYADIVVNSSYVGGAVKQYGNLSFSRVYDAGHFVPYFQPETAFQIFARVILGDDISTGTNVNLSSFISTGPVNSTHTNKVPPMPSQTCWVRSWTGSCKDSDTKAMLAGRGLVQDGIYYQDSSSIILPTSTVIAGVPGKPISTNGSFASSSGTSAQLTGVYTATGTPKPSNAAGTITMPSGMFSVGLGPIAVACLCSIYGIFLML